METLTEKIPALDNLPRTASELGEESELANELREAKTVKDLSETQLAELAELHASDSRMDTLMAEIRALGHIPRQCRGAENALSQRLYIAKRKRQLSESQLAELATLARSRIEPLPELEEPPDPQDPFGGYTANRLEQDLLMSTSGIVTQKLRRRVFSATRGT